MRHIAVFVSLAVCLTTGCHGITKGECTLIGCDSGLTTHLLSMPSAPFRVEVSVTGYPATYVYECADVTRCSQDIFFPGLIADRASVTVIVGNKSVTTSINSIVYNVSRPNGPDCPPECKRATVPVGVPT